MYNIKEALQVVELFRQISPSSLAQLSACGTLKEMHKGTHIFWDRDEITSLYFLIDGKAALYKQNHLYEKKVIFIYGSGQALNEVILQNSCSSVNCELLKDSLVLSFPVKSFRQIMSRDFALSEAVMNSMALKIRRLYHQLKNTSNTVRGDKRLAAKLWKLSLDHGVVCTEGIRIDFDLSITYLSELLGSKRETVSRQVKLLCTNHLLLHQGNRFIIPDREALKQYFQEETDAAL